MPSYSRLSLEEREVVSRGLSRGSSSRAIARELGRAPSTVTREISRNASHRRGYRAVAAQGHATRRRRAPYGRRLACHRRLWRWVERRLRWGWSPQQIARRLPQAFPGDPTMRASHQTIYSYLFVLPRGELRRELRRYLRQEGKRRRPHSRAGDGRGQLSDMISIEERPAEVADRTIPGHWESDLLIGRHKASALGTLVERTTRTVLLVPLEAKDAATVRRAFARKIKRLPQEMRRSITHDRGKEMAEHRLLAREAQIQVYFAHPNSPWERGTNENTNGLIRQYFPKGTDFNQVSRREIRRVQDLLNDRPRAVLDFQKPNEVYEQLLR